MRKYGIYLNDSWNIHKLFIKIKLLLPSDHLSDAIPEILKNMLLVMETTSIFHTADGFTRLWTITWDRIDAFLPDFRHQVLRGYSEGIRAFR